MGAASSSTGAPRRSKHKSRSRLGPRRMGSTPTTTAGAIAKIAGYAPLFETAFGDRDITYDRITKAIASFERTILSGNSPYDRYLNGDKHALSPAAKRAWRFSCAPANARNATTVPTSPTRNSPAWASAPMGRRPTSASGRSPGRRRDEGKFKVPTLREVAHTGPYMHDGRFRTLDDVLEFYRKGGQPGPHLDSRIAPFFLDAPAKANLLAFLEIAQRRGLAADQGARQTAAHVAPYLFPNFKRRPMIIFTSKWSVPPVTPMPAARLNSQLGPRFRSSAGMMACCWSRSASKPVIEPTAP